MTILIIAFIIILLRLSWKYLLRLEPAGVFAGIWIALIGLVILFQNIIIVKPGGVFYILTCVLAFVLGTTFCDMYYNPQDNTKQTLIYNKNYGTSILVVLFVLSLVNPLYTLTLHGFKLSALFSISSILNMNETISEDRYSGRDISNTINQVFLIFSYTAPLIGGFCYRLGGKLTKVLSILTLMSGLLVALTQAMKMGLISCIFLWLSGFIICSYSYRLPIKLNVKYIIYSIIGFTLLMIILFISLTLRFGLLNEKTIELTTDKFISYAFGSVSCFCLWFDSYDFLDLTYGAKTFWGISNPLGILERLQGAYQEFINIGLGDRLMISNVYTGFRFLIEDFGPWFSVFFMGLAGYGSKVCFKNLQLRNHIFLHQTLLSAIYAYVMWSFATSFFAYTSYIVLFFLAYFILSLIQTVPDTSRETNTPND